MTRFNAALALQHVAERGEQIAGGERVVPVGTAIIAVLAALATLLANHSSIRALAYKNEALLYQTQAADQYNFYESSIVRAQMDEGFLDSGTVNAEAKSKLQARVSRTNAQTRPILEKAQTLETRSEAKFVESERVMSSYESFEIAAIVFEIGVILASITAMTRGVSLLLVCFAATVLGFGFLISGFLH